jgi:Ulp1 family protease
MTNEHWIFGEINNKEKKVFLYDSLGSSSYIDTLYKLTEFIQIMQQRLTGQRHQYEPI